MRKQPSLYRVKAFEFLVGVIIVMVSNQIFGSTCLSHLQGLKIIQENPFLLLDYLHFLKMGTLPPS